MATTRNFHVTVNGHSYAVAVEELGSAAATTQATASQAPAATPTPAPTAAPAPTSAAVDGTPLRAPMPGTILKIVADAGSTVKQGDVVMILEAMKMENDIVAPCDGTVKSVLIASGQSVETNQVLATIG